MKALMRYYSYLFHLILALFLLAVSGLALASGSGNLHLGMLPWTGQTLTYAVFFGALAGMIAVFLAMKGTLRILFLLWSAVVVVLLIKGYIFSGYKFQGSEFKTAIYLIVASLIALPGAWFQLRRVRKY
jgi:ABC-type maltose transport system permease subunit